MAKGSRVAARQAATLEALKEQLDRVEAKLDELTPKFMGGAGQASTSGEQANSPAAKRAK